MEKNTFRRGESVVPSKPVAMLYNLIKMLFPASAGQSADASSLHFSEGLVANYMKRKKDFSGVELEQLREVADKEWKILGWRLKSLWSNKEVDKSYELMRNTLLEIERKMS